MMYFVDHETEGNKINGEDGSFKFIMYIIWIMHVIQFFTNTDMVVNEKKDTPIV
jgi:hypothetical protein